MDKLRDILLARLQSVGRLGEYELAGDELRVIRRLKKSGLAHSGLFRKTRLNDVKHPDMYISLHRFYFLPGETRDMEELVFPDK